MRYFASWIYTAREGTILYGWACFRLALNMWKFLIFYSDKYETRDMDLSRIKFFETLSPSSTSSDFIRNNHLRLQ